MKKRQQKKIFTNVYKTWHQAQLANQSWGLTASENIDQYIDYDKCQLEKLLAIHKVSQAIIFAKKQTKGWRPARKTIDTRWHNAIINSMPMEDVYPI